MSDAEDSDQPDGDQINSDDIVQQPRHGEYKNSGDQGYQGGKSYGDVHVHALSSGKVLDDILGFSLCLATRYNIYAENAAVSVRSRT